MNLEFGIKLRRIREHHGYSQEYVSFQLNISQRAYSKIERNEVKVSLEKLNKLSELYQINLFQLILFDESIILNHAIPTEIQGFYRNIELLTKLMTQYNTKINFLEEELNKLKRENQHEKKN